MLSFIMHFRTAWSDYFPGTNPTITLGPKEYDSRQTPSDTNVYVSNCLFNRFTSSSTGGALYCTSVTCLLIESTSFFSCKTSSGSGGAIHFYNTNNGQCVLNRVCGNDCCMTTSSSYQFSRISVKNDAISKSYIDYSSITRCVNELSAYNTMLYDYGRICFLSVNISMNKCGYRSAAYCYSYSDSNSATCLFSYSSFADNIATDYNCIYFNNGGAKYEIKCCNIIRNTQVSTSYGTIYANGNLKIEGSCILENVANYIIFISSSSYMVTISNCTVDNTASTGTLIIQNTVTKSFILALDHMSTRNCYAEYDSAGTLTSKKMACFCTCKILFCQSHLRDFISLILVFLFNFIYPCPSIYS
jgi:hypothetical protein